MTAQPKHPLYFPSYGWDRESLAKRMRMCRGLHQLGILELIRQRTEGRRRPKGAEPPEWTDKIVWAQVAEEWGCTAAALRKEAEDGAKRGIWEIRNEGGGVNLRARYENWENVADIARKLTPRKEEEARAEGEESAEEAAKKQATREEVREFPVHEGRPSKVVKMSVPPSSFSVSVEGGEARISGIRQGPHLSLSVKLRSSKANNLRQENATGVAKSSSGAGTLPHGAAASPPRGRPVVPVIDPPGTSRPGRGIGSQRVDTSSVTLETLRQGLQIDAGLARKVLAALSLGATSGLEITLRAGEMVKFVPYKNARSREPKPHGAYPALAKELVESFGGLCPGSRTAKPTAEQLRREADREALRDELAAEYDRTLGKAHGD